MTQWQPPHGQPDPAHRGPEHSPGQGMPVPGNPPPGGNGERWPPPAELAKYENAAERRKRVIPGVVMAVAGIIVGLLSYTGALMLMHQQGEPGSAANPVTVITNDCDQYGPISRGGLGYWWECTADEVDGSKTVHTSSSELTPDDIGKPVDVYAKSKGAGHAEHYYRDVEHPLHGVGIAVGTVGLLVVIGLLGNAFMRLVPQSIRLETDKKHAEKLREQYRREGRL